MKLDLRRWSVFNLIGFSGFLVQIAVLSMLVRLAGWPAFWATVVALEVAALQNFLAHSRWTFGDRPPGSLREGLRRYGRYQAAKSASLLLNLGITMVLARTGIPPEIANTAAVLMCAIPNYLVSEYLIYTHAHADKT